VRDRPSASTVNRVYDNARCYAEDNRTELNFTHWGKSEAEVTIVIKKLRSIGIVLLKLTTDRYGASRSLFATAELLVAYPTCIRNTR